MASILIRCFHQPLYYIIFGKSDYTGVASALVRMGATTGPVDEVKFGRELEEVILKISAMTPDLIVSSSTTPNGQI